MAMVTMVILTDVFVVVSFVSVLEAIKVISRTGIANLRGEVLRGEGGLSAVQ